MTTNPDTCLTTRADLVALLDGELDEERAVAIRAHLSGCAPCQAERDALAGSWKSLDLLPGLEPRAGLFAEIEARVLASASAPADLPAHAAPRGQLLSLFGRRAAGLAAAALLTAGLGFGAASLLRSSPAQNPGGQIAAQPAPSKVEDRPQPIDMGQAPLRSAPALPSTSPGDTQPRRGADEGDPAQRPSEPGIPRIKVPVEAPDAIPEKGSQQPLRPEAALASVEWQALDAEERAVVENLDLLISLDEVDDLELVETLEVLEDLTDEELGEG